MKETKYLLCWLFVVMAFVACSAIVYGAENSNDKTLAPYFFVEGKDGSVDSFPLKGTSVTANINGVIADIYVVQTYANEGEKPINASYVFPASTRVSVHGMKMEIGDNVVVARIKEREEAKQEFEEAKSEGKSASLLEQQRPNVFTMNIANIMPGDVVRVELHYTEMVVSTEGVYQFVFPTVVGPRYTNENTPAMEQWAASPYLPDGKTPPGKYDITVNLSTGVAIAELSCKSHEIDVAWDNEAAASVTLANSKDFAGNRDFILDYKLAGRMVNCGLTLYEDETEKFFMLMIQPPERVSAGDILPREYIFVLDVSGSMHGYPLDTAKELIRNLIGRLKETDTFNLILFSGASKQLSAKSLPASADNIKLAINLIERENGWGGTELAPALKKAVSVPRGKGFSRSVVVITDGYIAEEKAIFDIINKNLDDTNFFSFGIGTGVNRHLTDGIAKAGLGESFVVTEASEAKSQAERFREYIQSPVLTNINVKFNGFEVYDVEPAKQPDLFAQRPIVVFGKWRGEPTGEINVSGNTGNGDFAQTIAVSGAEPSEDNSAIRFLWARTKVETLTDYGLKDQEEGAVKKAVTELGLKYSMMTPHTSFVAVLEKVRNTCGESADVNQPLPLPLGVSNLAVGGYGVGSEPGFAILAALALAVLVYCSRKRRRRYEQ